MARRWPDMRLRTCNRIDLSRIDIERFWSRVDKRGENECWNWSGKAYGSFAGFPSHRIAYTAALGPIPCGLVVGHKCDNPRCCNPSHLEAITHGQNTRDAIARGLRYVNPAAARKARAAS